MDRTQPWKSSAPQRRRDCQFYFDALEHPEMPVQHASLLLRYCQLPKLGYLGRTMRPDRLKAAAARFDERALECWKQIHQIKDVDLDALSHQEECGGATCTREQLLSRISLSVSKGGMGLRPVSAIMHQAYLASGLEALPELFRLRAELQATNESERSRIATCATWQELAALEAQLRALGLSVLNRKQRRQLQRIQNNSDTALPAAVTAAAAAAVASPVHANAQLLAPQTRPL
jgi:hypothetical protein